MKERFSMSIHGVSKQFKDTLLTWDGIESHPHRFGGIPRPNHPIYKYTQGKPKVLLDVAGTAQAAGENTSRQQGGSHYPAEIGLLP
jgi:hypothetical protein